MVSLNVYTIKYIRNHKEYSKDFIAADPEIACQNFARWVDSRYYRGAEAHIVELTLIAEGAIHYKTNKRKR